jgi:hypothetical protein
MSAMILDLSNDNVIQETKLLNALCEQHLTTSPDTLILSKHTRYALQLTQSQRIQLELSHSLLVQKDATGQYSFSVLDPKANIKSAMAKQIKFSAKKIIVTPVGQNNKVIAQESVAKFVNIQRDQEFFRMKEDVKIANMLGHNDVLLDGKSTNKQKRGYVVQFMENNGQSFKEVSLSASPLEVKLTAMVDLLFAVLQFHMVTKRAHLDLHAGNILVKFDVENKYKSLTIRDFERATLSTTPIMTALYSRVTAFETTVLKRAFLLSDIFSIAFIMMELVLSDKDSENLFFDLLNKAGNDVTKKENDLGENGGYEEKEPSYMGKKLYNDIMSLIEKMIFITDDQEQLLSIYKYYRSHITYLHELSELRRQQKVNGDPHADIAKEIDRIYHADDKLKNDFHRSLVNNEIQTRLNFRVDSFAILQQLSCIVETQYPAIAESIRERLKKVLEDKQSFQEYKDALKYEREFIRDNLFTMREETLGRELSDTDDEESDGYDNIATSNEKKTSQNNSVFVLSPSEGSNSLSNRSGAYCNTRGCSSFFPSAPNAAQRPTNPMHMSSLNLEI